MMPVSAIRASIAAHAEPAPRHAASSAPAPQTAPARALVPLPPIASRDPEQHARPQVGFLAHLIATDRKLPQTRERRRAEPADAIAAYAAADAATGSQAGRTFVRFT